MFPTVLLVSDRPQFEDAWRNVLVEMAMEPRVVRPDAFAQSFTPAQIVAQDPSASSARITAVVIDAGAALYDEDELLAAVGLSRAMRAATVVALPEGRAFASIEDLLEDLCGGLVARPGSDLRRIAGALARRRDGERAKRFEYLTVSPRPSELLAVLGDGTALLLSRPVSDEDDGSEVESITLEGDAHSATLKLGSGRELSLRASSVVSANGVNGHKTNGATFTGGTGSPGSASASGVLAVDGARLGARLRELRLAAGLTQAELARRTGIHRPNIARVEAGRHTPSLETLARLASAIGVSTTAVLAGE